MSYPKLNGEEIARRGKELYEKVIRNQVETPENIGKISSINVETGEYEIGDDLVVTSLRLRAKQADAALWAERIGFDAVYAVGGTLVRTVQ
jgi:predicted ATP-dependent Lon-type protease